MAGRIGGTVSRSTFAVLRLISTSNVVGSCTGRSARRPWDAIGVTGDFFAPSLFDQLMAMRRCPPWGLTFWLAIPILSYMVNYQARLDHTFAALVDPTRRAILARLEREDAATVSELARPFQIKLPAVMKHLDVLDEAGLVTRSKSGRTVTVRLRAEPIREAVDWLRRYERFWSASLDRLAAYAEKKEAQARANDEEGRR
jgi:DNA-binding transcriptional ArsR family regulator